MSLLFALASLVWTVFWWALAWSNAPLLSEYSFFPLWLGYIGSINAISELLYKDSLLKRLGWRFAWLFIISMPLWWFFEYLNTIVLNWHYLYRPISELHYFLQSSIDFSTVIPAVLSVAFLFEKIMRGRLDYKNATWPKSIAWISLIIGILAFALMPWRPDLLFPFVWLAPLLVLDPISYWLGFPSILGHLAHGKWSKVMAIALAALFTGFWWEMWNFWSYPKWYYTIPYVGFLKVFEMPMLGYGGYLFFGLIIWTFTVFIFSSFNKDNAFTRI
ncbi:MAG TPA: hypothetical protein VGP13_01505 [Candidatus Paceibacterota bacterium]|jgi:hypothetical protein|nr:hypothetical protein [Candidatus Paceibacterota bacterium]